MNAMTNSLRMQINSTLQRIKQIRDVECHGSGHSTSERTAHTTA